MPRMGFGTGRMTTDSEVEVLFNAITQLGYRHIDTASKYANEELLGNILKRAIEAGVPREELFVVTKVWVLDMDDAIGSLKRSLQRLQLDYVDLYLIHWPISLKRVNNAYVIDRTPLYKTWRDMEACVKLGLARSIGVSNFNFQALNDLLSYCEIPPCANQIELNPLLAQTELVDWMLKNEIQPIAYSPLGSGTSAPNEEDQILKNQVIHEIAQKYKKSPGQVILNWAIERGHTVIPKSTKLERLKENFEALTFKLDKEDVEKITRLNKNLRLCGDILPTSFSREFPAFK